MAVQAFGRPGRRADRTARSRRITKAEREPISRLMLRMTHAEVAAVGRHGWRSRSSSNFDRPPH